MSLTLFKKTRKDWGTDDTGGKKIVHALPTFIKRKYVP